MPFLYHRLPTKTRRLILGGVARPGNPKFQDKEWLEVHRGMRGPTDSPVTDDGKQARGLHEANKRTRTRVASKGGTAAHAQGTAHKLTAKERAWGSSSANPKTWMYQQMVKLFLRSISVEDFENATQRYREARRLAKMTLDEARAAVTRGEEVPIFTQLMDQWEEQGGMERMQEAKARPKKPQRILWESKEGHDERSETENTELRRSSVPGQDAGQGDPDAGGKDSCERRAQDARTRGVGRVVWSCGREPAALLADLEESVPELGDGEGDDAGDEGGDEG